MVKALINAGKSPDTPAAIVRRCTWPDQQTIRCTLETIGERIAEDRLRPPVVVIVGNVTEAAHSESWFTSRPLFGKRVVITRPRQQAEKLGNCSASLVHNVSFSRRSKSARPIIGCPSTPQSGD